MGNKHRIIEKQLISKEKGTIFKDPGGRINIALCFPNEYFAGMSSLGFQGIYGFLNSFNDIVCERFFTPSQSDMGHGSGTGELFSLESGRRLSEFEIIAFSVSFENDYPNVLRMLAGAKIPLRSSERDETHPLVIMGGVCAFFNPEPLSDFMDILFVGEAEDMLAEFLTVYRSRPDKHNLLEAAASIEGLYIPGFYEIIYDEAGNPAERHELHNAPAKIKKRTIADISRSFLRTSIITPDTRFSNMYLVEAMRGCPWSCRFCVAGHIYKPVRKKEFEVLAAEVKDAAKQCSKVGIVGPSLSDYAHAEEVLGIEGVDFSITSLRASPKSARLVSLMKNNKSISIAPEAGSERMRRVINKKITDKDIYDTAKLILDGGTKILRLYFMIGLPTETDEDIDAIVRLVKNIRGNTKKGQINLSVSTFVPKPFTPFQWHPMDTMKSIKEKFIYIKKGLSSEKGVKVLHDVTKDAYLQAVLALGSRRTGRIIERIALEGLDITKRNSGCLYLLDNIYRKREYDEMLPWDFIDAGVSKEMLWNEYQKALSE